MLNEITNLRQSYQSDLCKSAATYNKVAGENGNIESLINIAKKASGDIGTGILSRLGYSPREGNSKYSLSKPLFVNATREFLQKSFDVINCLFPYKWDFFDLWNLPKYDQYEYLLELAKSLKQNQGGELASELVENYFLTPDIIIGRSLIRNGQSDNSLELRYLFHASISCKWTLQSDRGQNAPTEALNLIRHRKGNLPHIVAVTAEPLPTRIASLALGTGDLDCVYHFALNELQEAIIEIDNEDQKDMLQTLIAGRRLRDISDLPFDLAI